MAALFSGRLWFFRSIIFKNVLLFLLILLVAVVPLALRYDQDSRDYEIQYLASKLEFFAERGASWIDVEPITTLTLPEHIEEGIDRFPAALVMLMSGGHMGKLLVKP